MGIITLSSATAIVKDHPLHATLIMLTFTTFFTFYYTWSRFCSYQGIPNHFPFAGAGSAPGPSPILRRFRSSRSSAFGLRDLLWSGYQQHSLQNRPFILPNIVSGHELIIPPHYMSWLLDQPDAVLSQFETNKQFLAAQYTMPHPSLAAERDWPRVANQIRREVTRELDALALHIVDESCASLRELWGDSREWRLLDNLHGIMQETMARLVGRVFVGEKLCRHPGYLGCSLKYAQLVNVAATFIQLTPRLLRPFIAPVFTAYDSFQYRRLAAHILPIIRERAAMYPSTSPVWSQTYDLSNGKSNGNGQHVSKTDEEKAAPPPNDFIQWALRDAYRHGEDPCEPTQVVAKRLAVITWAALQSSAITITNLLVDIAHAPTSLQIQEELRTEALRFLASTNPTPDKALVPASQWSRASLARHLPKMDSALTESLRLWGFVTRGVTKTVVAAEGVTLPESLGSAHLPRGSKVGIANFGPQHDESVYGPADAPGGAFEFDAFRFSRAKENANSGVSEGRGEKGSLSGLSFVTTGEHYMGFSHGRHACPGRYFANHQLKTLLAQIVLRYEIEPIEAPRPLNPWLNNSSGPPIGAAIRVRRREWDLCH